MQGYNVNCSVSYQSSDDDKEREREREREAEMVVKGLFLRVLSYREEKVIDSY